MQKFYGFIFTYESVKNINPISTPLTQRYLSSSHSTSQFTDLIPRSVSEGKNDIANLFLNITGSTLFIVLIFNYLLEFLYIIYIQDGLTKYKYNIIFD